jgi:lipopolysaccharide transport system permease protein
MKGYIVSNKLNLWNELWSLSHYKEVFTALVWRNIRLQYNSPILGLFWGIFSPLLMSTIFYVALGNRIGVDFSNYFIFVYSGFIFWNVFTASLGQASMSLIQNNELVKRIYFPRLLLPLSFLAAKAFDFIIAFVILSLMLAISELDINWIKYASFTTISFICLTLVSSGFCLIFSVLSVRFRGLQVVYPFIIQVIFFTSSVIYDSNLTIDQTWLKTLFAFNPITGILTIFRTGVFNQPPFWELIALYFTYSLLIFVAGFIFFKLEDKKIIDLL